MAELEEQLRRYADQVEASVPATPVAVESGRRPRLAWMAAAAVFAMVIGVGLALASVDGDPVESPTEPRTEVSDAPPTVTTEPPPTAPERSGLDVADDGSIDPGPLAPRHDALILRTNNEVLIWGGDTGRVVGAARPTERFVDGAVLDLASAEWRTMAEGPLPAIQPAPMGIWLGDEALIIRGSSAALYDPSADAWTELPDAPYELWEIVAAPELGAVIGSGEGGVAVFDLAAGSWSDTGAAPASAFNRRIEWTGTALVSVWGSLIGSFPIETWTPADGWVDQGVVETGRSQVAIDIELVDDEVWIVGYDMTVDAWDPATGRSRSLPSLPVQFWEGSPGIHRLEDGRVVVDRRPGVAYWTGDGWTVGPLEPLYGNGLIAAGPNGTDVRWEYFADPLNGASNVFRISDFPGPADLSNVLIGLFVLELASDESIIAQGVDEVSFGVANTQWATIGTAEGSCRFEYTGGVLTDAPVHIAIGERHLVVDCDPAIDPARFLDRLSDTVLQREEAEPPSAQLIQQDVDRVIVPDVAGLFFDSAAATLRNAGLALVVESRPRPLRRSTHRPRDLAGAGRRLRSPCGLRGRLGHRRSGARSRGGRFLNSV